MGMIKWLWDRFHFRKTVKAPGPWKINLTKKLFSRHPTEGISHTFGGKWLSWNTRRKTWRSNPPGFGWFVGRRPRKK